MSLLEACLRNPRYQPLMQKLTHRKLQNMGAHRGELCKCLSIICCGHPEAKWTEIREDAAGIFWEVFLADAQLVARAEALLIKAQKALEAEKISVEDVWETVLDSAQVKFRSHVMEESRREQPFKRSYQRIRQILAQSVQVMMNNVSGKSFFALPGTPPDAPAAPSPKSDELKDLPPPKELKIPMDKFFQRDVLLPLAGDFWKHYVAIRCNGRPHFVSVYIFVCWLAKRYILVDLNRQVDAAADVKSIHENDLDIPLSMDAFPDRPQPDVTDESLQSLAALCTDRFQPAEVIVCALHFTKPAETMQNIAAYMGLSGAGGVAPYKERCLERLRSFMAEYSELSYESNGTDRCAQDFLYLVHEECVKRLPSATATWKKRSLKIR